MSESVQKEDALEAEKPRSGDLDSSFSYTNETRGGLVDDDGSGGTNPDTSAGSLTHLQSLFQATRASNSERELQRKTTQPRSNKSNSERTPLLTTSPDRALPAAPLHAPPSRPSYDSSALGDLFSADSKTPKTGPAGRKAPALLGVNYAPEGLTPHMPINNNAAADEHQKPTDAVAIKCREVCKHAATEAMNPSTWIGAFMFVLYHVVFCLAAGSAIIRPHATTSILGLLTKMSAIGIILAGPIYLINVGTELPALYPTNDLFPAPFLANIAVIIDQTLADDPLISPDDNDSVFLATFAFLCFCAFLAAGLLMISAGIFKLANLGTYLPFPVLCGFFSAVGILTWQLGFVVDTSGKTFHKVFFSGDTGVITNALIHHIPGVCVACLMKYLGPRNPFYVIALLLGTVVMVYVCLFCTGTSLDQARDQGWFWHPTEMVYQNANASVGFKEWLPPAPFGMFHALMKGKVHWEAVKRSLDPVFALAFLYLIRCSLHGAALKKNLPNLVRKVPAVVEEAPPTSSKPKPRKKTRSELFSEMVDIEEILRQPTTPKQMTATLAELERAKPTTLTLQDILMQYGYAQIACAFIGSFGVIPCVAASPTMFTLKAEGIAPQLGSFLMLLAFYLTNFKLMAYVPKMAFSCLLDLAFIDIFATWFFKSYFKTKEKMEWFVVPLIVAFAFVVGLLASVFLGIAISTFLFVAAFFRSGVVKFAASGLTVRSTIERSIRSGQWLDQNGDFIQIVVLQNYLFFGNASSILNYTQSMFEETDCEDSYLPPLPKFVVLDLALVTGMDTSTVDIFSDILNLCKMHNCKLFLSGLSPDLRAVLSHAGVKPLGGERKQRALRFFDSLDTAIGKAEDMLLESEMNDHSIRAKAPSTRKLMMSFNEESGFQLALRAIDDQHGTSYATTLQVLEEFTTPIELEPNESLYDSTSMPERGLFFIEKGVMKIQRDANLTANTRSMASRPTLDNPLRFNTGESISRIKVRSGETGLEFAQLKAAAVSTSKSRESFRLARVGVGWIVGAVEACCGAENPGAHLAVTACRLHYLSYSQIKQLETSNPTCTLNLYKLLSHILAKQQGITVGQLTTLHSIIASPAQTKAMGRKAALTFEGI